MFVANWATLWERIAAAVPDRPALVQGDRCLTYAEFEGRAARLAAGLAGRGIGAGARIACCLYNDPAYLEVVFAAFKASAVPVNVNYRYQPAELRHLLDDARVDAVFFDVSVAGKMGAVLPTLAREPLAVQVGGASIEVAGAVPIADLAAGAPMPRTERGPDDSIVMYTGGTTGLPKAVEWSQHELWVGQRGTTYGVIGEPFPETEDEAVAVAVRQGSGAPRALPVTPLMHATALFSVMDVLVLGGCAVLLESRTLDAAEVWRTVDRHRASRLIIAGNSVCRPLVDELARAEDRGAPYDLSSLDSVLSSGMVWSDELKALLLDRAPRARLVDILASSEGGPYALGVTNGRDDLPTRFVLTPGTTLVDDQLRTIAPGDGRLGRLAYAGPMPRGYAGDPEKTAATFVTIDGVRHVVAGDYATVDAAGTVHFLGRGSGVINTGGEKVYHHEVEQVLLRHPAVDDCVVFGVPDERWGEVVAALVVPVTSADVEAAQLSAFVGESLAGYKKPRLIAVVDSLWRSPTGKVDMAAVRRHATEAFRGARP